MVDDLDEQLVGGSDSPHIATGAIGVLVGTLLSREAFAAILGAGTC